MPTYPPDAYSPSGQPWWELRTWPGKPAREFGTEPRLAAYLRYNAQIGDILTLCRVREALGEPNQSNAHEHFNRRFRQLRKYGWTVLSSRDVAGLKQDEYRLDRIGSPIWLGKSQFTEEAVSEKVRRQVFSSDGYRCVICGIGADEPYPDEPTMRAQLTPGHFIADPLRGLNDPANLRTECSRCNEPAKEQAVRSESARDIWPKIRDLNRAEKQRLFSWIEQGHRSRDNVDILFDQYRSLPASQRDEIRSKLTQPARR